MQGIKEHREQDGGARIQVWWSHITGNFAAKLKARAKIADMQAERSAAAAWGFSYGGTC